MEVTARVDRGFVKEYKGEGPILKATEVKKCSAPDQPVIDFSQPEA